MSGVLAIFIVVVIGFFASVFFVPQIKVKNFVIETFWIFPVIGVIALLSFSFLTFDEIWQNLTANTSVNPLKILTLFFSMTIISIYLDEAGFFRYLASRTASKSGGSQKKFFYVMYLVISVLTVFTSNDIIILTFTPFLCYFCKNARISAKPYLIMEFVAANTWSMFLIIGNPTNIYLATSYGLNFLEYSKVMALPTIVAGLSSLFIMRLLFSKQLKDAIVVSNNEAVIEDKFVLVASLITLIVCVISLVVSSFFKEVEMWYIAFSLASLLIVVVLIYKFANRVQPKKIFYTFSHLPWLLIPFVLAMFIMVLALQKYGITAGIASSLNTSYDVFTYGLTSFLLANVLNNIPMSVLFSSIATTKSAVLATIIASNIGALLSPVGALAGIMWSNIIKSNGVKMSMFQFVIYGAIVSIPTLILSLGTLYGILLI